MITVSEEIILNESVLENGALLANLRNYEKIFRQEPGCKMYEVSVDIDDPKILRIYEEWDSREALSFHFDSEDMAQFQRALGSIKPKAMSSSVFESENELRLEDFH